MNYVKPYGFQNIGAICYLSSILQMLLSFTSLLKLANNKNVKYNTILGKRFNRLFKVSAQECCSSPSCNRLNYLSHQSFKVKEALELTLIHEQEMIDLNGCQDAHEVLAYLLDMLNLDDKYKQLNRLLNIGVTTTTICNHCQHSNSRTDHNNALVIDNISNLIEERITLNDYTCDKCKTVGNTTSIKRLSELNAGVILVFQTKYVDRSQAINYPLGFEINGTDGTSKASYKAIGQIHHTGGHYYATCIRNDKAYIIDDLNVKESTLNVTPNVTIVMYERCM